MDLSDRLRKTGEEAEKFRFDTLAAINELRGELQPERISRSLGALMGRPRANMA